MNCNNSEKEGERERMGMNGKFEDEIQETATLL